MVLLEKEDVLLINEKTFHRHGGNFVPPANLLKEGPLEYLLEAVNGELFGKQLYPTIPDKAAFYMFQIVTGHVFQDGNKRTGLGAALLFLKLNGENLRFQLKKVENNSGISIPEKGETPSEILLNFTLEMASGKYDLEDCKLWFKENIEVTVV